MAEAIFPSSSVKPAVDYFFPFLGLPCTQETSVVCSVCLKVPGAVFADQVVLTGVVQGFKLESSRNAL